MVGIGDFIKVKPKPINITPPGLGELDLDPPKTVRMPSLVSHRNAWFFDGKASTCPHTSGTAADFHDEAMRPEISTKTSEQVVYDVVDIRKPELMVSLPEDHKQAGILIKHAGLFMGFDDHMNCCNLQ